MKEHYYYGRGNRENIIVSNTAMSSLNPKQGGSPSKFLKTFDDDRERLDSRSVQNGKVIHAFVENSDNFAIDQLDKLEPAIKSWGDEIVRIIQEDEVYSINDDLESSGFASAAQEIEFMLEDGELSDDELRDIALQARENKSLLNNIKKYDTLVKKFTDSSITTYILFLLKNSDNFILSATDGELVRNCKKSLEENTFIQNKIFRPENDSFKMYKEIAIFFIFPVTLKGGDVVNIKGKALIDSLHVDSESNNVIINDLKTTGSSIYSMSPDKSRGTLGTVESFRYYRQLAWYKFAVECLANPDLKSMIYDEDGNKMEIKFNPDKPVKVYTNIVAVETHGEFISGIIPINSEWIKKGDIECESIIHRLAWHIHKNIWDTSMEEHLNGCIPMQNPIV